MATRPKGYLPKGNTKSSDAVRKANARKELTTLKGIGGIIGGAILSSPGGRGLRAARAVVKVGSQAEKKAISLSSARTRANIDKMEKSGNYKKVGNSKPKPVDAPKATKPKPSTKEVVGRTMRKRAYPKLTPKEPLLQQPASKLDLLKKKQFLNELMSRPVVRNRKISKRSTQSLTPNEKRYEKIGERARVTVKNKEPMSETDIKKTKGKVRKEKFNKLLTPVTPIGKARPGKRASLPSHKVDVLLRPARKKYDTSRAKEKPEIVARYAVGKKVKSARVIAPRNKAEDFKINEANAKSNPRNWEISDQRPKTTIAEGRGNIQQPPSVTTQRTPRTRSESLERRLARRADRRDRRTDVRENKQTPRIVTYKGKGFLVNRKPTTNHPGNTASDAGNMEERLKVVDNIIKQKAKQKELYKGNNKISTKTKDKVDKTLETARILRKRLKAADRASKPKPRVKQRLSKTRPVPTKKK
jgi:hypothetical protein